MSKLNNPKLNTLRANANPYTLAYLDAVIEEQDIAIDALLKQTKHLEQEISECRGLIKNINDHLDNNAEYSLTKAKVVRLMKKMELL